MKVLLKNKIWDLVSLLKGKKIVGCKSVFSINHKADRSIEQSKERLVAKGYTQTYDIDHQETLSPVEKLNIARVLLFLVANLDYPLHQFDVKNVFFHGDLEKEVYMDIPLNYIASSSIGVVWVSSDCRRVSYSSNVDNVELEENQASGTSFEDDSDDCEFEEVRCELGVVEGQLCNIPFELYDLPDLREILSLDTWNSCLTEDEGLIWTNRLFG
ncbi:Retrovirus-related Pol polyprotein from transposon TNT 1-94 [Vitis vinifera]|uniref:Retrovirus-related Pol polyprotein from transposon TNT 1-94 n=1 Tax=Vitis vinifera TaxID=29760 RepID=A0A438C672_VITVI|nr:Retrovirus-related Pol polyprotein from transposon TNT 1-94 [Vitis vinifera]